jgi:hypothetical protein
MLPEQGKGKEEEHGVVLLRIPRLKCRQEFLWEIVALSLVAIRLRLGQKEGRC